MKGKRTKLEDRPTNNLVVVSDTHCGCALGLYRESPKLDDGGGYAASALQRKMLGFWDEFWESFVPEATRGEPFTVVHNGDAINGKPHGGITNITDNLTIQRRIAETLLRPIVQKCEGRYYHIRGTEAHVGKSAQDEEELARTLGARPNDDGQHARYDLWKLVGPSLVHLLHHIGTTGSAAYEATAVHKELTESFVEAGRWGKRPPDVIVRSHRHRAIEIKISTSRGNGIAAVTPGWQGKTPFVWKIPGARLSEPQFGGIVVRHAHGRTFVDFYTRTIERSNVE